MITTQHVHMSAIAMKRRSQEQIYEDTKDMKPEEFIAHMHQRIAQSQFADFLNVAPSRSRPRLNEKPG